jgi:hypothetical protein
MKLKLIVVCLEKNKGHGDFTNDEDECFDYNWEDTVRSGNGPYPIIGNPTGHFQDFSTSSNQIMQAIDSCKKTVTVGGGCYYSGSVNYILYGYIFNLCKKSSIWRSTRIWLYKRGTGNYIPSQEWAKFGQNYTSPINPSSLPPPDRPECTPCSETASDTFNGSVGGMHF